MAFDREAYLREGRADNSAGMAALEADDKPIVTPFRNHNVNWRYLAERRQEDIDRLEAALILNREFLALLQGKFK